MKLLNRFIFVCLTACYAHDASAIRTSSTKVTVCNGCTVQRVDIKAAEQYVGDYGKVFVLDYANTRAWECDVFFEREFFENYAACFEAPQEIQNDFQNLNHAIDQMKSEISLPYETGNIYDIAGCTACARDWLVSNQHSAANQLSVFDLVIAWGLRFSASAGVSSAAVQATYEGQVSVKVFLANDNTEGREIGYCMGNLTGDALVIDSDRCFDSDGNAIPTYNNGLRDGVYSFTSRINQLRMIIAIRRAGGNVQVGTVNVGPMNIVCQGLNCESEDPDEDDEDKGEEDGE